MRIAVIDDEKYSRSELIHQIREVCLLYTSPSPRD